MMCYGHERTLDWQCLIWCNSRLLHLPKRPCMEPGSGTSALWLRWIRCIIFVIDGRRQTQFRGQQDRERPVALHYFCMQESETQSEIRICVSLQRCHLCGKGKPKLALLLSPTLKLPWKICALLLTVWLPCAVACGHMESRALRYRARCRLCSDSKMRSPCFQTDSCKSDVCVELDSPEYRAGCQNRRDRVRALRSAIVPCLS